MHRKSIAVAIALTLLAGAVLLLTNRPAPPADAADDADSGPRDAARAWFDAAIAADIERVRALTCGESAERVAQSALEFAGIVAAGAVVDASGLVYTTTSVEGDAALVMLAGSISATTPDATETVPMDGIAIPVVREDGAWKICGM